MEKEIWLEEKGSHRRRGKISTCQTCEKNFIQRKSGNKKYCSIECKGRGSRHKIELSCFSCGKKIHKQPSKLKNSKHGFYFCNRECKEEAQSLKGNCPEIRPDHYGTSEGREVYRNLIKNSDHPVCEGCGEETIYLLQVHHKDKDRTNNERENFEIVCANCHIKRHLYLKDGKWCFSFFYLTPRDMLLKL
jgi:hypothetical protein